MPPSQSTCPRCGWSLDAPAHFYGCPSNSRGAVESRYAALSGDERAEAIRESNQRAGGDPYGG